MKSFIRKSAASASDRRKVDDIVFSRGRYSPKAVARREARRAKGRCE